MFLEYSILYFVTRLYCKTSIKDGEWHRFVLYYAPLRSVCPTIKNATVASYIVTELEDHYCNPKRTKTVVMLGFCNLIW